MEDGLSNNQFLIEDGHETRSEDLIADDILRLQNIMYEFIAVMDRAKSVVTPERFNEYAVSIEQDFNCMLEKQRQALEKEGGWFPMPQSPQMLQSDIDTMGKDYGSVFLDAINRATMPDFLKG